MIVTVIKLNAQGKETWRYQGRLLAQDASSVTLEAFFDREDLDLHGMYLVKGDRFIETYYSDRWYNVFEIHAHDDDRLRGWYCNIGRPAQITGSIISYVDLALDLLVFADGRQIILDEEEFAALNPSQEMHDQAYQALRDLQARFKNRLDHQGQQA
jgi:uncharacterized protein